MMRVVPEGADVDGQLARSQRVSGVTECAADELLRAGALVSPPLGSEIHAHATGIERQSTTKGTKMSCESDDQTTKHNRAALTDMLRLTDPGCFGSSQPRGHASEKLQGGTSGGSRSLTAAAAPVAALADEKDDAAAGAAAAADDAEKAAAVRASPSSTLKSIEAADAIAG